MCGVGRGSSDASGDPSPSPVQGPQRPHCSTHRVLHEGGRGTYSIPKTHSHSPYHHFSILHSVILDSVVPTYFVHLFSILHSVILLYLIPILHSVVFPYFIPSFPHTSFCILLYVLHSVIPPYFIPSFFHTSFCHSPILHSVVLPRQMLHQHVMKSLSHHDFPVAISVFRLIKHTQGLLPEYRVVLLVGVVLEWVRLRFQSICVPTGAGGVSLSQI